MGTWVSIGALSSKYGFSGQAFHRESTVQELLACQVCFPPGLASINNMWLLNTYSWADIKGVLTGVVLTGGTLCITNSWLWVKAGQLGWCSALLRATCSSPFLFPLALLPGFSLCLARILRFLLSCRFWYGMCRVRKIGHSQTRWVLGVVLQERPVGSCRKTAVRNSPPRKD